jgi:hypothetical protein
MKNKREKKVRIKMVKCEWCAYDDEGDEIEGVLDIPWEHYVTKTSDGKEHIFCSHACQRAFELKMGIKKPRAEDIDERESARRKKITDEGKGSSYGTFEDVVPAP